MAKWAHAGIDRGGRALAVTSATYALLRLGPGALVPFFGLWLKAHGFSATEIGLIIAAPLFGRLVLAPALGLWADRFSRHRTPLIVLCLATALAALALTIVHGFWLVLAAWSVACICEGACTPLLDVATLKAAARSGFAFSAPLSVAAVAAVASGVGLGALFAVCGPSVLPAWSLIGSLAAATFIAVFVTSPNRAASRKGGRDGWGMEARSPKTSAVLALFILAAGLIQLSHGMNAMAMLTWRARGIDEGGCGLLWQIGGIADIAFLGLLSRYPISPSRLLILGGLGAAARWAIFAVSPPVGVLFLAQTLHALSFTATYIATVQLIARLATDRDNLFVQALYWAISTGLCTGVGTAGGGLLYQRLGTDGYWAMCALALMGLAVAVFCHLHLMGRRPMRRERRSPAYISPL